MEIIKISKKNLKELGNNLDGFYCGKDVYNYENIIYLINRLPYSNKEDIKGYRGEIIKEIKKLINYNNYDKAVKYSAKYNFISRLEELKNKDFFEIVTCQMAYSCGVYGNTAQLHKIEIRTEKNETEIFYTYYAN